MKKRAILRGIMLAAGLIAVCAILLSPTFSQVKEKKSTDKETVLIPAPSDAIPGNAVKVDQPAIPFLTKIEEQPSKEVHHIVGTELATKFLKVLFRTLIAPNAP
jgi:hypothetical protein